MDSSNDFRYLLQDATIPQAHDVNEADNAAVEDIRNENRQKLIGNSARLGAGLHYIPVGGCSLRIFRGGEPLQRNAFESANFYFVYTPLSGSAERSTRKGNVSSVPGVAAVISPGPPMGLDFAEDSNRLVVQFRVDLLERHLASYLGREIDKPIEFKVPFPLDCPGGRAWQVLTCDLAQKIDRDITILQSPLIATHYEQLLMSVLLQAQDHNYWDEMQNVGSPVAPYYVKRALSYMQEHADQTTTMETLVEQSGVSARSLYAGFQRFLDTTPMAYLKMQRLQHANADLTAADPAQSSVTDIATRWHFFHLGRFSVDYRKVFGESPSATLKRNTKSH